MQWKPGVTVAAILEQDGRFLLVEEEIGGCIVLNQPAGHLEAGESLVAALRREVLEETGRTVDPEAIVGVYLLSAAREARTFLRFCFAVRSIAHDPERPLDPEIRGTVWLTADELRAERLRHRSPLVMRCVDDYRRGRRFPLDLVHDERG